METDKLTRIEVPVPTRRRSVRRWVPGICVGFAVCFIAIGGLRQANHQQNVDRPTFGDTAPRISCRNLEDIFSRSTSSQDNSTVSVGITVTRPLTIGEAFGAFDKIASTSPSHYAVVSVDKVFGGALEPKELILNAAVLGCAAPLRVGDHGVVRGNVVPRDPLRSNGGVIPFFIPVK